MSLHNNYSDYSDSSSDSDAPLLSSHYLKTKTTRKRVAQTEYNQENINSKKIKINSVNNAMVANTEILESTREITVQDVTTPNSVYFEAEELDFSLPPIITPSSDEDHNIAANYSLQKSHLIQNCLQKNQYKVITTMGFVWEVIEPDCQFYMKHSSGIYYIFPFKIEYLSKTFLEKHNSKNNNFEFFQYNIHDFAPHLPDFKLVQIYLEFVYNQCSWTTLQQLLLNYGSMKSKIDKRTLEGKLLRTSVKKITVCNLLRLASLLDDTQCVKSILPWFNCKYPLEKIIVPDECEFLFKDHLKEHVNEENKQQLYINEVKLMKRHLKKFLYMFE